MYSLHYHFVQCVKYRRKALDNQNVVDFPKMKIRQISDTFEVDVINKECDKDHFYLLFTAKPTLNIPKYINTIKTITSREIRKNYPGIKTMLWKDAVWSRSYFIATTDQVTLDVLKQYVDDQGKHATDEEDQNTSN